MSNKQPIELFMPPNILKAKVGGTRGLDMPASSGRSRPSRASRPNSPTGSSKDIMRVAEFTTAPSRKERRPRQRIVPRQPRLKGQARHSNSAHSPRCLLALRAARCAEVAGRDSGTLVDAHVNAVHAIFRDKIKDISKPDGVDAGRSAGNESNQSPGTRFA